MVDLGEELHLDGLEGVGLGDDDVLGRVSASHTRPEKGRTTWKWPPSYGVPSGPSNEPMRWNGELSTRSMAMFEDLSFLQSGWSA